MIEAVFISDLHLSPHEPAISSRFSSFIEWAKANVKAVYILGDFIHVWAGDDTLDDWSKGIAQQLSSLTENGIDVYYMHGNRDFLLGQRFLKLANTKLLPDPYILTLGNQQVLLTHGDQYCTLDKGHQWLRTLTRNKLFPSLFLMLPTWLRKRIVMNVRHCSQNASSKTKEQLSIVVKDMLSNMRENRVNTIIHGHIHTPGTNEYKDRQDSFTQYVLSDWDDTPQLMCYYLTNGFKFETPGELCHQNQLK
jgi:UDP-2,3-diacylglucosamine hydrolase